MGIVEEDKLKQILSQTQLKAMDSTASMKYLIFAQFCTLVSSESLMLSSKISAPKNYYFFPNLVLQDRPSSLFRPQYTESRTWILKCDGPNQFFTPRSIHTLFILLARESNISDNVKLDVWKNGILLVNGFVRSVIEFTDQTRRIELSMQCHKDYKFHLVRCRAELILTIRALVKKLSPNFNFSESFLCPKEYEVHDGIEIPVLDIITSIMNENEGIPCQDKHRNIDTVFTKDLLYFDSLQVLVRVMLKSQSIQKLLFLNMIMSELKDYHLVIQHLSRWSEDGNKISIYNVWQRLQQFSIFSDHDLKVII